MEQELLIMKKMILVIGGGVAFLLVSHFIHDHGQMKVIIGGKSKLVECYRTTLPAKPTIKETKVKTSTIQTNILASRERRGGDE